jgi:hypothetical protein
MFSIVGGASGEAGKQAAGRFALQLEGPVGGRSYPGQGNHFGTKGPMLPSRGR